MGLTKDYLRYTHVGQCNSVGSANGSIVAIDSQICAVAACENVNIYNLRTADKVATLSECNKPVTCLQLNKDKRFMAVGYADGSIRLYDRKAEDQSQCVIFVGHKTGVNCLAFSNDGLTLASGGKDSSIILWDIVAECGMFRLNGHKESITQLQFTKDDKYIVSSCKDTFIKFWNVSTQSCFYTLTENRSEVYSFVMIKDDSLMITASSEMELYVFDLHWLEGETPEKDDVPDTKRIKEGGNVESSDAMENRIVRVSLRGKVLRQCKGRALQLAVSPDGNMLLCLGSEKIVDIYRVYSDEEAQKRLTKKLRKAKRKAAESSEEAPSAEEIARDVTVVVARAGDWRPASKPKWFSFGPSYFEGETDQDREYKGFSLFVNNSVVSVNLTLNLQSNTVQVTEQANMDQFGHREDVRSISVASHDALFVSGGGKQVIVWNASNIRPVNTLTDEKMEDVTAVLFAVGDRHSIAGTKNGKLFLFDNQSCECLEMRDAHEGAIWSLTPIPGKLSGQSFNGFVSASADKKVKFWGYELVTEGTIKRLSIREQRVLELPDEALCTAISPNGKFIVVGLLDTTAAVYFMDSLKFFISLYGHSLPVTSCSISPDSKLVVTGSADKSIKIWGLDFGDCHKSFHAHDDVVSSVLFSPNEEETLVWSAGRDGKIKQWDAVKFEKVQTLDRHSAEVRCLARTSKGNTLFSASHDKSIRVWDLTEEIIVLQEEEEREREEEYEAKLADDEDVVPGEREDGEAALAASKSSQSIVSTENIIDAVDIVRQERVGKASDPEYKSHPLILAFNSKSLDHFIVDNIAKVRPSNLERALLLLPLSYVSDIVQSLCECVKSLYKIEFCSKVAIFLIRVHHSHIINNVEMVPIVEKLRTQMPQGINKIREVSGFNFAALRLLATEIEEQQDVKMWADVSDVNSRKNKPKKGKKAAIVTVV